MVAGEGKGHGGGRRRRARLRNRAHAVILRRRRGMLRNSNLVNDNDGNMCNKSCVCVLISKVKVFFEKLDEELDKVNQFYKAREEEFLERGDALNKQHQILVDLKQILGDRRRKNSPSFRGSAGASPRLSSARTSNFSGESSRSIICLFCRHKIF